MQNQIIIVEGKTDTQKLKKIFGEKINTIETKGLALNEETLKLIKRISESNQIIIFTDPDGPGKKIREKITNSIDKNVYNAFINKDAFSKNSKKIGVAEAEELEIKKALENLIIFNKKNESLTWSEYIENDFYLKINRNLILKKLNINTNLSAKSLFKWLNWMQMSLGDLLDLIKG